MSQIWVGGWSDRSPRNGVVGRRLGRVGGFGWFRKNFAALRAARARRGRTGWVGGRTRSPPAGVGGWSDGTGTSRTGSTWANAPGPAPRTCTWSLFSNGDSAVGCSFGTSTRSCSSRGSSCANRIINYAISSTRSSWITAITSRRCSRAPSFSALVSCCFCACNETSRLQQP